MTIEIFRKWFTDQSTISLVFVNGIQFGYCLEDKVRPVGEKIHSKTAIPYGEYFVKMTMSNHFNKMMPLVYNQKDFSVKDAKGAAWAGIRMHAGNSDIDTDGCLLMGKSYGVNSIGRSREACDELYKMILTAEQKGDKINLKISNAIS